MKNWIYIIMMVLMGSLVSSCQQALDDEVPAPTIGKAKITFTIAMDDVNSRAAWEDNESVGEQGDEKDNQIDLTSADGLQVLLYDTQGNYLAEVTNKAIRKVSNGVYKFDGDVVINNLTSNVLACRLMVYANCINSKVTFAYNAEYIPMWGVKEVTLRLAKGELTELKEPVYLLRSMAKVEVRLDAGIAEEFDLTSVSINRYNATGYVMPVYETLNDTEGMDEDAVFNPYSSLVETALLFTEGSEDVFYIYLPEYRNVGEGATKASMTLMVDGMEYTLEFKDYATDTLFNIVRNHHYRYTITSVNTIENILVTDLLYQSMPWTDVDNGELPFN